MRWSRVGEGRVKENVQLMLYSEDNDRYFVGYYMRGEFFARSNWYRGMRVSHWFELRRPRDVEGAWRVSR